MFDFSDTKQIGETPEFGAPAVRESLSDLVKEYQNKFKKLGDDFSKFLALAQTINGHCTLKSAVAGSLIQPYDLPKLETLESTLLKSAWKLAYQGLKIGLIASAKDRKRFELMLASPPAFTLDEIGVQFGDYVFDQRFHKLKGLAECFTDLDPAYKSHSKVKIGVKGLPKRIIIRSCGGWHGWGKEKLKDTFNCLRTLRDQPLYEYSEFENVLDEAKKYGEADWCGGRLKMYQNGNGHVIFDDVALLDINRALAEFYGEVLPDAPNDAEAKQPSTEVSRNLAFYETQKDTVRTVLRDVYFSGGMTVLEPSCGEGAFLDYLANWHLSDDHSQAQDPLNLTGIEYWGPRAEICRANGHNVLTANFLQTVPTGNFDRVIMNPPFNGREYQRHITHAVKFLRPGGVLVSIVPASAHYDHGFELGTYRDLPVGSFSASGTNIPTGYIEYRKPD